MKRKSIPKILVVFCVCLLVLVEISSVFLMYKSSDDKTNNLATVNLNQELNSTEMFAILLEQSDGTYAESSTWPTNGYVYNEEMSGCIDANGNKLENVLAYNDGIATVDTNNTSYCYLYFSISAS